MKRPFADLHHHTEGSLGDGAGTVARHMEAALAAGHTAFVATEHGSMRSLIEVWKHGDRLGMPVCAGLEAYLAEDIRLREIPAAMSAALRAECGDDEAAYKAGVKRIEAEMRVRRRDHVVLVALDATGLGNLLQINAIAQDQGGGWLPGGHPRGGYPRIDFRTIEERGLGEGIHMSTACLGGFAARAVEAGEYDRAVREVRRAADLFEMVSIEIQPHAVYRDWNPVALRLSDETGVPLIATNDAHYPSGADAAMHDATLALSFGKALDDPKRRRYPAGYHTQGRAWMRTALRLGHPSLPRARVDRALERVEEVLHRVRPAEWRRKTVSLPTVTDLPGDKALVEMVKRGIRRRGRGLTPKYRQRVAHELKVFRRRGISDYFTLVTHIVDHGREAGMLFGPGRGSGASSLVCHYLGLTEPDPIEYDLPFERFLAPGRVDMPDLDIDVESGRRVELLDWIRTRFGATRVAGVMTTSRRWGATALKDAARLLGAPFAPVNEISSQVMRSLSEVPDAAWSRLEREAPGVRELALSLEGGARHGGVHAAGVVVAGEDMDRWVPVERTGGRKVVALEKDDLEGAGLLKLDFLGLTTLDSIAGVLRAIEAQRGFRLRAQDIPLDDPLAYEEFGKGDPVGLFQFDSATGRVALGKVGRYLRTPTDVAALSAAIRPGASKSGLADEWYRRMRGARPRTRFPDAVERIAADSKGVPLFQEHLIRILKEVGGFDAARADRLRRACSKSKGAAEFLAARDDFIRGAVDRGLSSAEAAETYAALDKFGEYAFNKAHSTSYGMITLWCAYLRAHYPVEFFSGCLAQAGDAAEGQRLARAAAARGIPIRPPCVVDSAVQRWGVDRQGLIPGLTSLRGVGERAAQEIERHRPYSDLLDFILRIPRRVVHAGVGRVLARAGAFRALVDAPAAGLTQVADQLWKLPQKAKQEERLAALLATAREVKESEADRRAAEVDAGVVGGEHPLRAVDDVARSLWPQIEDPSNPPDGVGFLRGVVSIVKRGRGADGRWCNVDLDVDGVMVTVRLDGEAIQLHGATLAEGRVVGVLVRVWQGRCSLVHAADLIRIREAVLKGEPFTLWERLHVRGAHQEGNVLCSVRRVSRKGKRFGFTVTQSPRGPREAALWADLYDRVDGDELRPGDLVEGKTKRGRTGAAWTSLKRTGRAPGADV